ncbi:MAG: SBBP repeat-containing protein [Candidatus Cloacimonetes bacterium]|nr:SBBP repeat-containing protein [Candidatus Cloacimonadota bacterium]
MKQAVIYLFFILISSVLFSQTEVQEEWINTIQDLSGLDIELDDYNNVYVLTTNCTIIKYDTNGVEQWTVTYEASTGGETAVALTVDNSNNICFTGSIHGIDSWHDIVTVKNDPDGNQLWEMIYQTPSWAYTSEPIGIVTDNSGNVYVSGYSYYSTEFTGYCQCVTIKYNSDGTEEWISIYEPPFDNWVEPSALTIDESGSVNITGGNGLKSGQLINLDKFVTIKYDPNGIMQWEAFYSGVDWATARAITVDSDSNIYIAGDCWEPEGMDMVTIKYNENGDVLWDSHYVSSSLYGNCPIAIETDFEGNVIIIIDTYHDFATIKYDQEGTEQWIVFYDSGGINWWDVPYDLAVDQYGNIYVTGSAGSEETYSDYVTLRYSPTGSQEWLIRYDGVNNYHDSSKAISLDNFGNIYITGRSSMVGSGYSCVTIKYSQSTYANDEDVIFPEIHLSNYPNPFNPSTTIYFSLTTEFTESIELIIYNIKGQKIRTLYPFPNGSLGTREVIWDGTDENNQPVSSGIYFYRLNIDNKTEAAKKMMLIK